MAGIIQSIITKLGKNASAEAVLKALEGKGAKLTPKVIDEVMASSLPQYEKDIFKSLASQSSKPGAIIPGASAAPTGSKTITNTKTTPKVASSAEDLMFGSKKLVADMRKVNKPENEIERAVRDAYPDLPEESLNSVMGRSSTQAPDTAQEIAVRTPVPTKTEPAYDGEARLKELQALKSKVKKGEYGVWGQPDKVAEPKTPKGKKEATKPAESSSRPPTESKQADMLDSIDDEVPPQIDAPTNLDELAPDEVAAMNSKGIQDDIFSPEAAPVTDDLSKGLEGDSGVEMFNLDLDTPAAPTYRVEDMPLVDNAEVTSTMSLANVPPVTPPKGYKQNADGSWRLPDKGSAPPDPSDATVTSNINLNDRPPPAPPPLNVPEGYVQMPDGSWSKPRVTRELDITDADVDELRGVSPAENTKTSGFAENLPPVPEDVRKPSAIIPGKLSEPRGPDGARQDPWEVKGEETYTVPKPPEMQQLDLSTPSGSRPDPANSQVTSNLDLGTQNKGMSKAVPGVLGLGALALSGDSRQTPADTQTSGTQITGGVQPTATPIPGEPGDGTPIKDGKVPQGTPVAEFGSADPSTDPSKSKVSASTRGSQTTKVPVDAAKASVDAKAVQTAATALETAQNQAGEIDKRVPGWGDALKQALGAQVSTYEKLAAELKQDMAAASDEYQAAQYRGMMGEALTAFAQALVKYGAASEGVKRKLDVAEHYKPTPADFTRVFQAIDNDFKQKTAAIQEALKGAKEGIQSANERLMKVEDRESEQAFKSQENEQAYLRDLKAKMFDAEQRMKELDAKAGYDKAAAAEKAKLEREYIALRGQWRVASSSAYGGAKGKEIGDAMKAVSPAVNAEVAYAGVKQADTESIRRALVDINKLTPSKQAKALENIAASLGIEPVREATWGPGGFFGGDTDVPKTLAKIGAHIKTDVPNAPAASNLAGKAIGRAIDSFSPAMQQKIVQQPNGAKVMINGQTYTKQDGMLVPAN